MCVVVADHERRGRCAAACTHWRRTLSAPRLGGGCAQALAAAVPRASVGRLLCLWGGAAAAVVGSRPGRASVGLSAGVRPANAARKAWSRTRPK
eukprot:5582167-Prymnesium_polylepis.1